MKVHKLENEPNAYVIWCPACQCGHKFDSRWTFNGDVNLPTFDPSLIVTSKERCHSVVTNGTISFLEDSSHAMAGKTVDLPDIEVEQQKLFDLWDMTTSR
jgi:hypothetical protein